MCMSGHESVCGVCACARVCVRVRACCPVCLTIIDLVRVKLLDGTCILRNRKRKVCLCLSLEPDQEGLDSDAPKARAGGTAVAVVIQSSHFYQSSRGLRYHQCVILLSLLRPQKPSCSSVHSSLSSQTAVKAGLCPDAILYPDGPGLSPSTYRCKPYQQKSLGMG